MTDNVSIVLRFLGYAFALIVIWHVLYARMYLKRLFKWKRILIGSYTIILVVIVVSAIGFFLYVDIKSKF